MRIRAACASTIVLAALMHSAQSQALGSVRDSILVGSTATPQLMDPETRRIRKLPRFAHPREAEVVRTADGRSLVATYIRSGQTWVAHYSLVSGRSKLVGPLPVSGSYVLGSGVDSDAGQVALATATMTTTSSGYNSDGPVRADVIDLRSRTARPLIAPIPAIDRPSYGTATNPEWFGVFRWSPNDRRVAFLHRHQWQVTGAPPEDRPFMELMVGAADGSSPRAIASDLLVDGGSLAWAPDSRRLVVRTRAGLQILDTLTGARKTISRGGAFEPSFSASGRHLAYLTSSGRGDTALHIRNLATNRDIKPRLGGSAETPSWAPRGERLVACNAKGKLRLVTAKGKVKTLGAPGRGLCSATWGPTPQE